ncbi:hypothetical protein ACXHXM_34195
MNLQPQRATPNTPFIRPEEPQVKSGVGDFLSALGKLNPMISQAFATKQVLDNDPQKRKDDLARIGFQTMGQSSDVIGSTDTTGMSEAQQRALNYRQGEARAAEDQKRFQEWYAQQPPGSVNVDKVFSQYRDEVAKSFGGNTTAVRGWTENMMPYLERARNGNTEVAIKEQTTQRDNTLQAAFSAEWAKVSADQSKSPAERIQQMQQMVNQNEQFIGAGAKNQQALLEQLVTSAAIGGDPEMIKAAGELELDGHRLKDLMGPVYENKLLDGQNVKTKNDQLEFQPKLLDWQVRSQQGLLTEKDLFDIDQEVKSGNKMLTRGTAAMLIGGNRSALEAERKAAITEGKKLFKENYLMSNQPQYVQEAMDGTITSLQSKPSIEYHEDATSTEIGSKDKIEYGLDRAVDILFNFENSKLPPNADDNTRATARADAEMSVYARNGLLPEGQKTSAVNLLKRSNPDMDITDADRAGAGDALRILKMGDGLIDEVAQSDKDKSALYTLQALSGTMPLDDAIRTMRQVRANWGNRTPMSNKDLDATADAVVDKLKVDAEGYVWNDKSDWSNDMSGFVKKQIRVLQNTELQGDALIDAATNLAKANTTKYNGFLIPTTGLPINDPKKLNGMLDAVAATITVDPKYKDKQVTFLRNGTDTTFSPFVIHNGVPIPIPGIKPYTFKQLQRTYNDAVTADPQKKFDQSVKQSEKNRTAKEMRQMSIQ